MHKSPDEYNPFEWDTAEWKDYLRTYVITSTYLSLVVFGIAVAAGLVFIIWRCIQWIAGCWCKPCCGIGQEDPLFLGDHKHSIFKAVLAFFILAAVALTVWGMVDLNAELLAGFWKAVQDVLKYGNDASDVMADAQFQLVNGTFTRLRNGTEWATEHLDELARAAAAVFLKSELVDNAAGSMTPAANLNTTISVLLPAIGGLMAAVRGASGHSASGGSRLILASAVNSTAGGVVLQLAVATPSVQAIPYQQSTQHAALQELLSASAAVQAALWGQEAGAVAALRQALLGVKLREWLLSWDSSASGLQVLADASPSYALDELVKQGDAVMPVAQRALGQASSLGSAMEASNSNYMNGSRPALLDLKARVDEINSSVADVQLTVNLRNGTTATLSEATGTSITLQDSYVATDGGALQAGAGYSPSAPAGRLRSAAGGAPLPAQAVFSALGPLEDGLGGVMFSVSDAVNATTVLNTSLAGVNSNVAGLTEMRSYVQGVCVPNLDALSDPLNSVVASDAAYASAPSQESLELLKGALLAAQPQMQATTAAMSQLPSAFPSLEAQLASLAGAVQATNESYSTLVNTTEGLMLTWGSAGMDSLLTGLTDMQGFGDQLPNDTAIADMVRGNVTVMTQQLSASLYSVEDSASDAADRLGDASTAVQNGVVATCQGWLDEYQDDTDQAAYIVYCVWMGMYALVILLLLVLLPTLYFNHGASMLVVMTLLMILVVAGQAVCVLLAGGMAVLEDACDKLERAAIHEVAQSNKPNNTIPMSFYLYKVPETLNEMLLYGFDLNVTELLDTVRDMKIEVAGTVQNLFPRNAEAQVLVAQSLASINYLNNTIYKLLGLVSYPQVNPLYTNPKTTICCDAGNFAYYEWCAMTSLAFILFVVLIGLSYLVARMDMTPRAGCCRCCHCRPAKVPYHLGTQISKRTCVGSGSHDVQDARGLHPMGTAGEAEAQAYSQPQSMEMLEDIPLAAHALGKQASAYGNKHGQPSLAESFTPSASDAHAASGSAPHSHSRPRTEEGLACGAAGT